MKHRAIREADEATNPGIWGYGLIALVFVATVAASALWPATWW